MDEQQRPIPSDTLPTRIVRFATVVLCATLCSAVVGAVGVKPSGAARPQSSAPVALTKKFEPVEMVPVNARQLPAARLNASAPLPPIAGPMELLQPITPRPAVPALKLTLPPPSAPALGKPKGRTLRMEVTAYCHCIRCCGPEAQGITASGKPVSYNAGLFVAADTNVLPFGTRLIIPGYAGDQPVEVIDRGGAIKGYKLDVYYPSHDVAREWGRRFVNVLVIE